MKKCILFAGVPGCSKTPTAVYLSHQLGLAYFNNDAVRTEIIEDLEEFDEKEFRKRAEQRLNEILIKEISIIIDASIDRSYKQVFAWLKTYGYSYYIISYDLSRELVLKFYNLKGYSESAKNLDKFLDDHTSNHE